MAWCVVAYILVTWFSLTCASDSMEGQTLVNYLGEHLGVKYTIVKNDNGTLFEAQIELKNAGVEKIASTDWEIYFCHIRLIEPETIRPNGSKLGTSGFRVFHVNGCLHKLAPSVGFTELLPGKSIIIAFRAQYWQVAKTDVMPNWYVVTSDATPVLLDSTVGESLDFVAPLTKPEQLKRTPSDRYKPLTPADRFVLNDNTTTPTKPVIEVVPTPIEVAVNTSRRITIDSNWVVVQSDVLRTENKLLANILGLPRQQQIPSNHCITMETGDVILAGANTTTPESYRIEVDGDKPAVRIVGRDKAGVFYGVQTLVSLALDKQGIPTGHISDQPRYPYRGLMLDVARNFRSKEDVLRLIDVMATYKLNKLHLHLADDEGWRLEIPGLPELTQIGSKRCHDLPEKNCTLSQLGSGPRSSGLGSGFYSQADYKEILDRATASHVDVIPEFDSPGHARAAIISMAARDSDDFLLRHPNDTSQYFSVQMFNDNAIDTCLNSTFRFMRHLVREVKKMHADTQPLKVFHFGGDEVARGAWTDSPACAALSLTERLKQRFVQEVAKIVQGEGLDIAGWEDGLMSEGNVPFNRSLFPNNEVYGYAWQNIWEWGGGSRAYELANHGYKVVVGHATHLYFDHPYEPDPEERGYYWATRYTDTRKVFNFLPDSLYDNIETDRMGNPLTRPDLCAKQSCTPLNDDSKGNIVGIQGHLWTETVRTTEQSHQMLFPRVLALAERAWHRAVWETATSEEDRDHLREADWQRFANALASKELAHLDKLWIAYRVPPPGARVTADGELEVNVGLPGLTVECSVDGGDTWVVCPSNILLRTKSADGHRVSRVVPLTQTASTEGTKPPERPTPTEGAKTTDGTETRKRPSDGASSLTVTVACLWLGLLAASLAKQ